MSPIWLGGDFNTITSQSNTLAGETSSSFKTLERPYVVSTDPIKGDNGTFLNKTPQITFALPSKNFVNSSVGYYKLYSTNRERMDQINTDYIIPSPPSSLSTNTLSHDCLSADTPTSKGTCLLYTSPSPRD